MINVAVVGATGYTGLELCRLLGHHPGVAIAELYSHSKFGECVRDIYPHLSFIESLTYLPLSDVGNSKADVIFLALPHGESHGVISKLGQTQSKIIDLSADFRLSDVGIYNSVYDVSHSCPDRLSDFIPGYTELFRDQLKTAQYCANPGCYSTAAVLALSPLSKMGDGSMIIIDGKSGVSGAGKGPKEGYMFCDVNNNFRSYSTGDHRHQVEMEDRLNRSVMFSPHLVPMDRGILISAYLTGVSKDDVQSVDQLFEDAYGDSPFIRYSSSDESLSTRSVTGSNFCRITTRYVENRDTLVVMSVIDNLIKGASGQAIQNMNVMCGLDEQSGLNIFPLYI